MCLLLWFIFGSIPKRHEDNYVFRKRTLNSSRAITTAAWEAVMARYKYNKWVYSCGKIEGEKKNPPLANIWRFFYYARMARRIIWSSKPENVRPTATQDFGKRDWEVRPGRVFVSSRKIPRGDTIKSDLEYALQPKILCASFARCSISLFAAKSKFAGQISFVLPSYFAP